MVIYSDYPRSPPFPPSRIAAGLQITHMDATFHRPCPPPYTASNLPIDRLTCLITSCITSKEMGDSFNPCQSCEHESLSRFSLHISFRLACGVPADPTAWAFAPHSSSPRRRGPIPDQRCRRSRRRGGRTAEAAARTEAGPRLRGRGDDWRHAMQRHHMEMCEAGRIAVRGLQGRPAALLPSRLQEGLEEGLSRPASASPGQVERPGDRPPPSRGRRKGTRGRCIGRRATPAFARAGGREHAMRSGQTQMCAYGSHAGRGEMRAASADFPSPPPLAPDRSPGLAGGPLRAPWRQGAVRSRRKETSRSIAASTSSVAAQ